MAVVRRSNIQHGRERRYVSRGEMTMVGVLVGIFVGTALFRLL